LTGHRSRVAALTALVLAAGAGGASPLHAATPSTSASSAARAYAKQCQNQSRRRAAGVKQTPFAACVSAMARLAGAKSRSPRIACAGLSRKRLPATTATPFGRCVSAGTRLIRFGNGIDRAYVDGMIPHHVAAVEMAKMAEGRAQSPFVADLAASIIRSQQLEIAEMQRISARLAAAGIEPVGMGLTKAQMGMDHDMSHLVDADPFDPMFVEMMIPHHEGAITMSRILFAKGIGRATLQLADQITSGQSREIQAMREFLDATGAAPAAGGDAGGHQH
jgi:uncharacterized protein (DUF305 family)